MGRPKDITPYASSAANYPAGTDPWAGTPIRVVPPTDYRIPRTPEPAEYFNYTLGTATDAVSGIVAFSGQNPADNWVTNAAILPSVTSGNVSYHTAWDNVAGRWIVAAFDGTSNFLQTLDGGKTWLALPSTNQPGASASIAVHPTSGLLVGITSSGSTALGGTGSTFSGSAWTARTSFPGGQRKALIYFNAASLFVSVGYDASATVVATSSDGITWTDRTSGAAIAGAFALGTITTTQVTLAQSATTLALFSPAGNYSTYYTTTNGTSYTSHTSPVTATERISAASYDTTRGLFVIVCTPNSGTGTSRVLTSPDAITWTAHNLPASLSSRCSGMAVMGSLYFVVGFSSGVGGGTYRRGVYSVDAGVTWRWAQNFVLASPGSADTERVFTNGNVFLVLNDTCVSVSSASGLSDVAS